MASPAAWAAGCPWLVEHSVPASRIHAHCQHSGKLGLVFKLLLVELAEQCVLRLVLCQVRFLQTFPQIVTCGFTVCNAACWGEVLKFSLTAFFSRVTLLVTRSRGPPQAPSPWLFFRAFVWSSAALRFEGRTATYSELIFANAASVEGLTGVVATPQSLHHCGERCRLPPGASSRLSGSPWGLHLGPACPCVRCLSGTR